MRKIGLVLAGALIFGGLMLVREAMSGIVLRALLAGIASFVLCLAFLMAQREGDGAGTLVPTGVAHHEHGNETMLRDAYAAFGAGDMDGYLAHCTDDIVFHIPGHGHLSGDHPRDEFFGAVVPEVMRLTGGTFHETVQDVLADDDRAAVFVTHEFERDGEPIQYDSVHVYRIQHGLLADFTEYPQDQYLFDHAWRPTTESVEDDGVVTPAV